MTDKRIPILKCQKCGEIYEGTPGMDYSFGVFCPVEKDNPNRDKSLAIPIGVCYIVGYDGDFRSKFTIAMSKILTNDEAAKLLGVSRRPTIERWLDGTTEPTPRLQAAILKELE